MADGDAFFTTRQVGTTGHELLNPSGEVIGWTVDAVWAAVVVNLLNTTIGRVGEAGDHPGLGVVPPDHSLP
jgi:hypothetical protein